MPIDTLTELCDGEAQRLYEEGVEKIVEVVRAYCDEYDDEIPRYGSSGVRASITLTITYGLDPIREVGEVSVTSAVKLPKPRPRRERVDVTRDGIGAVSRQPSMFEQIEAAMDHRPLSVVGLKRGPNGIAIHGSDDE